MIGRKNVFIKMFRYINFLLIQLNKTVQMFFIEKVRVSDEHGKRYKYFSF